ncbi:unnamed protein product, partial [Cladocopium goreaui]
MAGLSSMLSRGISRRQLSSLQNQCEALERGIEEAQAKRLRCWTCAERQRSEAAEMELCLQRFPPIATTSVEPPLAATRQRCEALTTEAAMESAFLDEARMEMKEMQALQEKLKRMQQEEMQQRREIQTLSQQLSSDLRSLESERQTLMEEELLQEEFLMKSRETLEERDRELAESSAYWEAVPFLSSETAWVEDWQQDLQRQRRELSQLQSELTPGLRTRTMAEEVAALKASAEKEQQTLGLWSAELQSPSPSQPTSPRDVAKLLATHARLKEDLARLQAQAVDIDTHRAHPRDDGLSRVLAATGARTVENMKEVLKQNLLLMQELQETLTERKLRCDKEAKLRRALDRRLDELSRAGKKNGQNHRESRGLSGERS